MWHSLPIEAVAFDLDGTLFNTEILYDEVGEELLRRRGKEFTSALKDRMMGRPGPIALQIMIDDCGLDCDVATLAQESDDVFDRILEERLERMPGAEDLLTHVEALGLPKAICTSSHRAYAQRTLSRFAYLHRFAFLLTSDEITEGKPEPYIYLTAASQFGVKPERMLVLEDSHNGCKAAVRAGACAVAVPSRHSRHHDFAGAAFVAEGLGDQRIYELLALGR
jgi:HAD superfamily hydrolase (TIGR01509 family)